MATAPNPWAQDWGGLQRRMHVRGQVLSRRHARRMSRRFAGVGIRIPPARLREIAAGAPSGKDESTDVCFALAATAIEREERLAKLERGRRLGIELLIVAGLALVVLNFLACIAYVIFSLAQHALLF